jgi:hypothetical protein
LPARPLGSDPRECLERLDVIPPEERQAIVQRTESDAPSLTGEARVKLLVAVSGHCDEPRRSRLLNDAEHDALDPVAV